MAPDIPFEMLCGLQIGQGLTPPTFCSLLGPTSACLTSLGRKNPPLCGLLGFPVMAFSPLAICGWGIGSSGRVSASPQCQLVFQGIGHCPNIREQWEGHSLVSFSRKKLEAQVDRDILSQT